jgi:hypothetical protein
MIPWVDEQCTAWGNHRRWMLHGVDGWPERSILGRLMEEGPGAGHESVLSHCPIKDPPESYTLVSVALQKMAETHELEKPIQVLQAHYVLNGRAKEKAPWVGVSLKQYWNLLHTAHAFIAGAGCWVPRETNIKEVY